MHDMNSIAGCGLAWQTTGVSRTEEQISLAASGVLGQMVDLICSGEWPSGMHLSEVRLAKQFGVSRTPVREALSLLREAGLATRAPGRGCFVAPFDFIACCELLHIRAVLEGFAAGQLASRFTPVDILRLREMVRELAEAAKNTDYKTYAHAENMFHDYILSQCGNGQLRHLLCSSSIGALIRGMRERTTVMTRMAFVPGNSEQEHGRIVDAIESGNALEAERCMREHVFVGIERFQRMVGPVAWAKGVVPGSQEAPAPGAF